MSTEQLPLLPDEVVARIRPARRRPAPVPAQLRLDAETRRIGLAGLAQVKAILAAQEAQRRAA
ncbi:MAG: hypothetical protein ACKO91_00695 [Acidimicrobiales bacterium]